jgi:DNA-binding MarR family transcriptional regulator
MLLTGGEFCVSDSPVPRFGGVKPMQLNDSVKFLKNVQKVNNEMPLQQLLCLLVVAKDDEGLSLTEVAREADVSLTTASRYISALGKQNRKREEGLNLIESYEDPMERRKKIIRLTPKGKATLRKLLGA